MNQEYLYLLCKNFLEGYNNFNDYEEIKCALEDVAHANYIFHNCEMPVKISFIEIDALGCSAKVGSEGLIKFNTLRIETLKNLKIDCFDDGHLDRIYNFYNNYDATVPHSKYEKCLYDFMVKYIELNAQVYFSQMGSYKNLKFELLETLLHENKHVFQNQVIEAIDEGAAVDKFEAIDVFTVIFQRVFYMLNKYNIEFDYERKNYIFPIEFDARYYAMVEMNNVKNLYFSTDNDFKQAIVNSYIVPQEFDPIEVSNQIYNDYLRAYELYKNNLNNDYIHAHDFIIKNKENIIEELIYRYKTMLDIVKDNQI